MSRCPDRNMELSKDTTNEARSDAVGLGRMGKNASVCRAIHVPGQGRNKMRPFFSVQVRRKTDGGSKKRNKPVFYHEHLFT